MYFEKPLALPVGMPEVGESAIITNVPGVVESVPDGPQFIRWPDGSVTFPFGWIRDNDEYIAPRKEIQPSRCRRIHLGSADENKTDHPHRD